MQAERRRGFWIVPRMPGRLPSRAWARLRRRVFDAYNWRCGCGCGRIAEELHHVDGDRSNNDPANLLPLAKTCHVAEHDRLKGQPLARRWRELVRELG